MKICVEKNECISSLFPHPFSQYPNSWHIDHVYKHKLIGSLSMHSLHLFALLCESPGLRALCNGKWAVTCPVLFSLLLMTQHLEERGVGSLVCMATLRVSKIKFEKQSKFHYQTTKYDAQNTLSCPK